MMGLSDDFSTITACIFMAQSVKPIKIPNSNKPITNKLICDMKDKIGKSKQNAIVEKTINRRQPYFAARAPVIGMATRAPPPKQSSNIPRVASFAAVLILI